MNSLASWLAATLSRALEPHERDALHGDHAELGVSGVHALRDVLGLVLHRQLQLWGNWQPWVVLLVIALPAGWLLSTQVANLSQSLALSMLSLVMGAGWPAPPGEAVSHALRFSLIPSLHLAFWSWACGVAIAILGRRVVWIHFISLLLLWFFTLTVLQLTSLPITNWNADGTAFPPAVYRYVGPILFQFALLFLPLTAGIVSGLSRRSLPLSARLIVVVPVVFLAATVFEAVASLQPGDPFMGAVAWTPIPVWPAAAALVAFYCIAWRLRRKPTSSSEPTQ